MPRPGWATAAVLNAIYEEDFLGFSYGFRPGRSQHDALDALVVGITSTKVNYILDCDIRSFFDEVSQEWLIRFLNLRIPLKSAGDSERSRPPVPIEAGRGFR
jgi:RNA-directed DNA polymerase